MDFEKVIEALKRNIDSVKRKNDINGFIILKDIEICKHKFLKGESVIITYIYGKKQLVVFNGDVLVKLRAN